MKRRISLVIVGLFTATLAFVYAAPQQQYAVHQSVDLAPSSPHLTAVDPFKNGLTPSNPLKPARPFWYSVDKNGLTIVGLRTETTGALMVGGPPIEVVENVVVGYVPWPAAIPITQPDGEVPTDPTVTADHDKFAWRDAVGGWEPVGITVSYPTEEALASNSETPPTYVYVVMKHSGYEWQSTPKAELPAGRDPNLRDRIAAQPDLTKDGSLLVQVDVSQPNYPVDLFPTGPPIGGGLLGHDAGQPAFDVAADSVYVGNMPSTSLPTTPQVPNDLTSFVSVLTLAPGELPAPGEVPAPVTVTVLCGPEHPEVAILAGVPQSWACIAEGGEGPFQWTFTNLPGWLTAHVDPITGQGDGILYGTPTVGTWTFAAHVDDNATTPPGTGDATITLIVTSDPATEYEYGELEWEVGAPAAVAIEGTGSCELAPTSSPGSMVPSWVDVKQIPGRKIDNTALGGPVEFTIGCVVMGTPPISGERYEFHMPNLKFTWPSQNLPIVISGQVAGPYTFDPLPTGVGLSGLAWHQIDKIHDASTEADLLNREFFGVEPYTGKMYRIVPAYAGLEAEGTIVPPPALQGELDEVMPYAEVLTTLTTSRPEIAAALAANPNLKVKFGDLVAEASHDPNVYVSAVQISDSTGIDPTVIPIGGPLGSTIAVGAMLKVSGTRSDPEDPTVITLSSIRTIDLPGVQAYYLGLDSDLAPAIPGSEPGQVDHGVLWVTGTNAGNVVVVDTALGQYAQLLAVAGAASLGGVSVNPDTRFAYVAGESLFSVIIFGPGTPPKVAPVIWSASTTTFYVGSAGSFTVMTTGSPMPTLSNAGTLPTGVTFVDHGDGTATLAGTPAVGTQGSYPFTITAANGESPDATQSFTLTVRTVPPAFTSASTASFAIGYPGSFTVTATGAPKPTLSSAGSLPTGVTFVDNGDGTATLAGTPAFGTDSSYPLVITAANGVLPDATQNFTLTVVPGTSPAITSVSTTTFTVGSVGSFTVTATGSPMPTLSYTGTLPGGVTFVDNGNGTATLAGIPAAGTQGSYPFTITAANVVPPDATQNFTLTVDAAPQTAPAITSASTTTFTVGSPGSFTVTATGSPTPTLTYWGTLPVGVTFVDNGNATATLGGTPAAGMAGSYPFTITAANVMPPYANQNFTLVVNAGGPGTAPAITSASTTSFTVGSMGSFTVTTTGSPTPTLSSWGTLPGGVLFNDNGNGTATLAGIPIAGTSGSYQFTITAANGVLPDVTQNFTLTVNAAAVAPAITTQPANQTVTAGQTATFSVVATGTAPLSYRWRKNGVDIPGATSTSYTTPATTTADSGSTFSVAVQNSAGSVTSGNATLTVNAAPVAPSITTHPANQTVTAGQTATFSVVATGTAPLSYQWRKNGADIPGATSASYTTPATTTADNGSTFSVVVTNSAGSVTSNSAALTVNPQAVPLDIVTTSLPNGLVAQSYSTQLEATGGSKPYTWSLGPRQSLPPGLTLSQAGVISGTPTRAGNYTFRVQVTDFVLQSATERVVLLIVRPPRR